MLWNAAQLGEIFENFHEQHLRNWSRIYNWETVCANLASRFPQLHLTYNKIWAFRAFFRLVHNYPLLLSTVMTPEEIMKWVAKIKIRIESNREEQHFWRVNPSSTFTGLQINISQGSGRFAQSTDSQQAQFAQSNLEMSEDERKEAERFNQAVLKQRENEQRGGQRNFELMRARELCTQFLTEHAFQLRRQFGLPLPNSNVSDPSQVDVAFASALANLEPAKQQQFQIDMQRIQALAEQNFAQEQERIFAKYQ